MLVYPIVPFSTKQEDQDRSYGRLFIPQIVWNKDFFMTLVAIPSTPPSHFYLFFWQASVEVEELRRALKQLIINKKLIHEVNQDVDLMRNGTRADHVTSSFWLQARCFTNQGSSDRYGQQGHCTQARDRRWHGLPSLAIGVIGTGLIAVPVLSGSLSLHFLETFGWQEGLDKKFHGLRGFIPSSPSRCSSAQP